MEKATKSHDVSKYPIGGPAKPKQNITRLANDINNQLSGIIGSAELLKQERLEPFERSKLVSEIIRCAKQTTSLVSGMLGAVPKGEIGLINDRAGNLDPVENDLVNALQGTVLVIDDEPVVRNVSKAILRRAGYKVITASNGREGLEAYQKHMDEVLCVLLDLTMPFLPGNLVFAKLKAINPKASVFLMSGLNVKQLQHEYDPQSVAGFIQKPFLMDDLLEKISKVKRVEIH